MSVKKKLKEIVLDFLIKHVSNIHDLLLNLYAEIQIRKNIVYANNFLAKWRAAGRPVPGWLKAVYKDERENCQHLKGGPYRIGSHKDYNLACHRFSNLSLVIWCLNGCGFSSHPGDENWKQAKEWFELSSNGITTSEAVISRESDEYKTNSVKVVFQDNG